MIVAAIWFFGFPGKEKRSQENVRNTKQVSTATEVIYQTNSSSVCLLRFLRDSGPKNRVKQWLFVLEDTSQDIIFLVASLLLKKSAK